MAHIRQTVRAAIFTLLTNDAAFAAVTVHKNRSRPVGLKTAGEKAIEILVPRERSERIPSATGGKYSRDIEVQLVGYVSATDDDAVSAASDALALAVEKVLEADTTLGGVAIDCWLQATDFALDAAVYSNASFAQTWIVQVTVPLANM